MKPLLPFLKKLWAKRSAATLAIVVGAALIVFARRSMQKVNAAKSTIDHLSDFFTNGTGMWNPLIKFFGGQVREQASKYDTMLSVLLVIGIALTLLGILSLFLHRRKS